MWHKICFYRKTESCSFKIFLGIPDEISKTKVDFQSLINQELCNEGSVPMNSTRKLMAWVIVLTFSLTPQIVLGHGGEDHGDSKPVVTKSGMTAQLASSEELEVLLKYPRLISGQEGRLLIFVTEIQTNAPRTGLSLELRVSPEKTVQATNFIPTVQAASDDVLKANATSVPGMYEVTYLPNQAGKFQMVAHLKGNSFEETITFSRVPVASVLINPKETAKPAWWMAAGLVVFAGIGGVWLIWKHRRKKSVLSFN